MKQWGELETFKCVDLQDSFVIGWNNYDDVFFIDMEASLWPGHPQYETPNKDEYTCYKKARLEFRNPKNINGLLTMNKVKPNMAMNDELTDYDEIEIFELGEYEYHLVGSFGDVTFIATSWDFKVDRKNTNI